MGAGPEIRAPDSRFALTGLSLVGAADVTAATARRTRILSCIVTVVMGRVVFL
jgi:hypothetical protein